MKIASGMHMKLFWDNFRLVMEKGKAGIAAKERKQDNGHLHYNLN